MHVRDFLNIFWYSVWERDVGRFAGEKKRGLGETLEEEEEKVLTRNLLLHKRRRKKKLKMSLLKKLELGRPKSEEEEEENAYLIFAKITRGAEGKNLSSSSLILHSFFRDAAASSIFFLEFFLSA